MTEEIVKPKSKKPSAKEQAFIESFLVNWNYVKAAEEAGYSHAKVAGWKVAHQPHVAEAIKQRLEEKAISASEVIARLCEQATLNPADFFEFEIFPDGRMLMKSIKWEEFYRRGHLVKGITYNRKGEPVLEFHDAQAALGMIGKYLRLFTEQVDLNVAGIVKGYVSISPDDWDESNPDLK